jgi:hypothetical protein
LGGRIIVDGGSSEIGAVVGDSKYLELRDKVPPTVYFSAFQQDHASIVRERMLGVRSAALSRSGCRLDSTVALRHE